MEQSCDDTNFIVNMITKYSIPVFLLILLEINALKCRTEGSLKSEELRKIYNNCVKQYNGNSKNSSEQDWRDRRSDQTYSDRTESEGNRNNNNGNGGEEARNWMDERIDRKGGMYENGDNEQNSQEDDTRREAMNGRNQYSNNGQSHSQNERQNDRHRMNNRRMDGRNNVNNYQHNDRLNEPENFQNDEYGSESQSRNMYSNSNHRYKRGRSEKNSGQRSQYNPNTKQSSDDNHRASRNSSDSSKEKACAMHCFLDNLKMTGENGMPDRYLVTNAMTKDVRNEDLRDFLQESIEECFQILDNENSEDTCEFSKNLLICLSEKGQATCDDWKDDIQFT